jgi:hypothetical protein
MLEHHTGNWRLAARDVVKMLLMPSMMVGVHFEADLGRYFEVTTQRHAYPGEELSTRPGFCVVELHQLYFDYIAPFWEEARLNPRKQVERTYTYLESEVNESDRQKKKEQIEKGLHRKGHAELVKMSKCLMSLPLSFNILLNSKVGRHFARALCAVVKEKGTILFPDDNNRQRWDSSIFSKNIQRPHQEQIFYEMMTDEAVGVTHWYQQIGFNRSDVRSDLKNLTIEEPGSRNITLLSFRSCYPVIFSALYATFALMPSTTRLTEQSHGALRDLLPMGVSMMFTDTQQAYMMDEEYHNREACRKKKRQEKRPA